MQKMIPLKDYSILNISGEDATSYLQGQLTVDVEAMSPLDCLFASQCDSKGKAWSNFYLLKTHDNYQLIGNCQSLSNTERELKKYGVFSKVTIDNVTESKFLYGQLSDENSDNVEKMQAIETEQGIEVKLLGSPARQLMVLETALSEDQLADNQQAWNIAEIRAGVPHLSAAVSGEFVPQMYNLQALGGISFTKGCYMGQETIARTKYLGKNKRAGFVLQSATPLEMQSGDILEQNLGDNWRRAGTVIATGASDDGTWVFAVLPNDLATETVIRAKQTPDALFSIQALPYEIEESA
ncbi:MAG: tRNA-modifying protein YgfZ [Alteromonadaceae bacterium]|nr:tRNA-modifying protein YgfZ [Alteromonadaceae bacterium]